MDKMKGPKCPENIQKLPDASPQVQGLAGPVSSQNTTTAANMILLDTSHTTQQVMKMV